MGDFSKFKFCEASLTGKAVIRGPPQSYKILHATKLSEYIETKSTFFVVVVFQLTLFWMRILNIPPESEK